MNNIPYIILTGRTAPRSDDDIFELQASTAIIQNRESELFLALAFEGGQFGLVGGMVESGESKDETIVREIAEETGYKNAKIEKIIFERALGRGYKARKNREELGEDKVYFVTVSDKDKGEVIGEEGIENIHWFDKNTMLQKLNLDHHLYYFKAYLNGEDDY